MRTLPCPTIQGSLHPFLARTLLVLPLLVPAGCNGDDGDRGSKGPPGGGGGTTSTDLDQGDELPGVVLAITKLSGGSGPGGRFLPGDTIAVEFTVEKTDGSAWDIDELSLGRTLVSGPTFNYQRVIAEQGDVLARAVKVAAGTYRYKYASPIPATYLPPLNDSASFGPEDGELTGEALLDGTYTLGLYVGWSYTVDGEDFRDVDNATIDFVVGTAGTVDTREVVKQDNCNRCHQDLRAHGGSRRDVTLCLLCHTSGSEDRNDANYAGGTPGVTIDFKVMLHKIHTGEHLPSVLGVATNPDGTRDYAATPQPYQIVGFNNTIHDFSEVAFPIMPSAYVSYLRDSTGTTYLGTGGNGPMPRDVGFSGLTLDQKELEDRLRVGVVACAACHGDPDGSGPLTEPAQGALHRTHPSRLACGSCHDDVAWDQPYTSNGQTMPALPTDADCTLCHDASGNVLAVEDAHRHPYLDAGFNTGVNLELTSVTGGSLPSGNHDAGDPIEVTFSVRDDAGDDLQIHQLTRFQMIVTGPTANPQWVLPNVDTHDFTFRKSTPFTGNGTISKPVVGASAVEQTIAIAFSSATTFDVIGSVTAPLAGQAIGAGSGSTADVDYNGVQCTVTQGTTSFADGDRWYFEAVPTASSYTLRIPRNLLFERLGSATGAAQSLAAANQPVAWGREVVYERTAFVGSAGSLTADSQALVRHVVADADDFPGLAVGDRVVVDEGTGSEEYGQVSRIETEDPSTGDDLGTQDRIYLTQHLRYEHSSSGTLQEVTLTSKRQDIDYTLATSGAGGIDLVAGRFAGGNAVVMSYRTEARFGWYRHAGDDLQDLYAPATGDSEDIGPTWGDWTGIPLVDGTYTVGAWAHKDFTVTPLRQLTATGSYSDLFTDNTTYRMISPPASARFLFGAATELETRDIISSGDSCNACHGDLQAHGNGRRGFDTCILCHASPGMEDAPLYSFNGWYIDPTPAATMDFRTLLHKIHMGKDLANASTYEVNGIFLGVAYPASFEDVGFPSLPGGTRECANCHGASNDAWHEPAERVHPTEGSPVRHWAAVCAACHDSTEAQAHIELQTTDTGMETCGLCHGEGDEWNVELVHKSY